MSRDGFHRSVLYQEVLDGLDVEAGQTYVDATLGGGGHAEGILKLGGRVVGIDIDPEAVNHVKEHLKSNSLILEQGNFVEIDKILRRNNISEVSGVIFDLGVSSFQLDSPRRGFGFKHKAPLDMRMSPNLKVTAADLVNGLNEGELYELFSRNGEERYARRIARAIVRSRFEEKIETTDQLAKVIEASIGGRPTKVHPATRVFLALRIAVNNELDNLKRALPKAASLLKRGGRLVVISFHSLEDRKVKSFIRENLELGEINKKPIIPTDKEVSENPRSRSAKLRVAEKLN
jgi:16S rRNA (cytosine1402-N4)-methyltransferase